MMDRTWDAEAKELIERVKALTFQDLVLALVIRPFSHQSPQWLIEHLTSDRSMCLSMLRQELKWRLARREDVPREEWMKDPYYS